MLSRRRAPPWRDVFILTLWKQEIWTRIDSGLFYFGKCFFYFVPQWHPIYAIVSKGGRGCYFYSLTSLASYPKLLLRRRDQSKSHSENENWNYLTRAKIKPKGNGSHYSRYKFVHCAIRGWFGRFQQSKERNFVYCVDKRNDPGCATNCQSTAAKCLGCFAYLAKLSFWLKNRRKVSLIFNTATLDLIVFTLFTNIKCKKW